MKSKPVARRAFNPSVFQKYWIISDIHASPSMCDLRAFQTFLAAYSENEATALFINGDLLDLSMLMGDKNNRINPNDPECNLEEEIDFCIENILVPLKKAKKNKVPIFFKEGNHESRIVNALNGSMPGLQQLVRTAYRRRSIALEDLLRFDEFNMAWAPGDRKDGVTILGPRDGGTVLIHGTDTSAARLKNSLMKVYPRSNVTSGHTHKREQLELNTYFGKFRAVESGCLCRIDAVPYLVKGKQAGWGHSFVTCWVNKRTGKTFVKGHPFDNYELEFDGQIYSA